MPDIAANRPAAGAVVETAWGQQMHDGFEGIQMGQVSVTFTSTQAQTAVVFPRAYATPPFVMVMQPSAVCQSGAQGITTTGFNMVSRRTDGNASSTSQTSQWVAIGTLA